MSLFVLDTDHVTLHQRNQPYFLAKMQNFAPEELAIIVVTIEEQMRGRLAQLNHPKIKPTFAYALLQATADYFCDLTILPFDADAETVFQELRMQKIRIGTFDLRIAAIVLRHNGILLTRNQRDFAQVPHLQLEDWSQ